MSDKLARARHTRSADLAASAASPQTQQAMHQVDNAPGEPRPSQGGADQGSTAAIGGSAALISICTIISRITGFARTWAMAFALGFHAPCPAPTRWPTTCPTMLYELVCGRHARHRVPARLRLGARRSWGDACRQRIRLEPADASSRAAAWSAVSASRACCSPQAVVYTQTLLFRSGSPMATARCSSSSSSPSRPCSTAGSAILSGLLNAKPRLPLVAPWPRWRTT